MVWFRSGMLMDFVVCYRIRYGSMDFVVCYGLEIQEWIQSTCFPPGGAKRHWKGGCGRHRRAPNKNIKNQVDFGRQKHAKTVSFVPDLLPSLQFVFFEVVFGGFFFTLSSNRFRSAIITRKKLLPTLGMYVVSLLRLQ